MKILLADDDRVLTTLLTSRLRARGVETIVAHDAMQVLICFEDFASIRLHQGEVNGLPIGR